jgi:Tol biopolymer transport system component
VVEGVKQFALSETGTLAFIPGSGVTQNDTVALMNEKGEIKPLSIPPGAFHGFRFSPDGKRLVFSWHQTKVNLWIYELDRHVLRRFTDEQGNDWTPLWTPDSKSIVFQSNRAGQGGHRLFLQALEGEGSLEQLTETDYYQQPGCWTTDGKALLFQEGVFPETLHDIMLLPLDGDRTPRPLLRTKYNERFPALSPGGRWLAYGSDESGRWEVYARHYPDLDRRRGCPHMEP